jgi:hypothetical protein
MEDMCWIPGQFHYSHLTGKQVRELSFFRRMVATSLDLWESQDSDIADKLARGEMRFYSIDVFEGEKEPTYRATLVSANSRDQTPAYHATFSQSEIRKFLVN